VKTEISVRSTLVRGTASRSRDAQVSYLVTVLNGETIIDQRDFSQAISFPPGLERAAFSTAPIQLSFPAAAKSTPNYRVFVSFKLTPDELAYNRAHISR
jgi:hypothetical protein